MRRLRGSGRRRGAMFLLGALALAGILAALSYSFLFMVALRGRQSAYERHAVQAMYAAEAGVEAGLAALAAGSVPRGAVPGDCGDGRYVWTLHREGRDQQITSTGVVTPPVGQAVSRRVVVTARVEGPHVQVLQWRREAMPVALPGPEAGPATRPADTEG